MADTNKTEGTPEAGVFKPAGLESEGTERMTRRVRLRIRKVKVAERNESQLSSEKKRATSKHLLTRNSTGEKKIDKLQAKKESLSYKKNLKLTKARKERNRKSANHRIKRKISVRVVNRQEQDIVSVDEKHNMDLVLWYKCLKNLAVLFARAQKSIGDLSPVLECLLKSVIENLAGPSAQPRSFSTLSLPPYFGKNWNGTPTFGKMDKALASLEADNIVGFKVTDDEGKTSLSILDFDTRGALVLLTRVYDLLVYSNGILRQDGVALRSLKQIVPKLRTAVPDLKVLVLNDEEHMHSGEDSMFSSLITYSEALLTQAAHIASNLESLKEKETE